MPENKARAALLLGTNLGDREQNLATARGKLSAEAGTIVRQSSIYVTAAWGLTEQPDFLNQALLLETQLFPEELLNTILAIESAMGRQRSVPWGPRVIDIDILYYDEQVINEERLKIPHPFLPDRRFSLLPLAEISPEWMHPVWQQTTLEMLESCPDTSAVEKY